MEDTNKSFNLKDLINPEMLSKYVENNLEQDIDIKEDPQKKREELRKKLRAKTNILRNNRSSKEMKETNQINMLKENPLFKNIENADEDTMKKMIESMAAKMTNDPKQKKNAKKQMESLIEKMKI
jgi:hypothetical protein